MPITESDIRKIAALAHLEITDDELRTLAPQVASIVEYVEQLNALDTSHVEPAIGGLTPEGERTAAVRDRPERLFGGNGRDQLVVVVWIFRFVRLLDLEQIHRVDHAAGLAPVTLVPLSSVSGETEHGLWLRLPDRSGATIWPGGASTRRPGPWGQRPAPGRRQVHDLTSYDHRRTTPLTSQSFPLRCGQDWR